MSNVQVGVPILRIGGGDFYRPGGGEKGAELGCIAKVSKPFLIHCAFFKSSYERYSAMGKMMKIPVNVGVGVKGLEYQ